MATSIKASEDLRPMSDLKSRGAEIVRQASDTGRPVVLTRHGRGVAVVLALADYEQLCETADRHELQLAVLIAEREVANGDVVPHAQMLEKLRRWSEQDG